MKITIFLLFCCTTNYSHSNEVEYSNEWIVEVDVSDFHANVIFKKNGFKVINKVNDNLYILKHSQSPRSSKRRAETLMKSISSEKNVLYAEQQQWNRRVLRNIQINDPQWPNMWYMNGRINPNLAVETSWNKGYTGQGIAVGIVDDGVESSHPDLIANYDRALSYDFYDRDGDPSPDSTMSHGTRCAGVALAEKNTECTVGVAFKGKLAGLRILGPSGSTSAGERDALLRANVDVFSNSWGTIDKTTFEGPHPIVKSALVEGIKKGRNGLGSIYVWAAGNGGAADDNCNCDGFVNSIYTIAINGVSSKLQPPGYAEPCAAVMASTFSGGGSSIDDICTTSLNKTCVTSFTGTSAATPLAAGIFALVLEANPNLTWRDLQHLIVNTSELSGLKYQRSQVNGAGITVSDFFGFGLLQTDRLIEAARQWTRVNEQHQCTTTKQIVKKQIQKNELNRTVESVIFTNGCVNESGEIEKLEHVEVTIKYQYSFRGACQFYLVSPSGTKSQLLTRRSLDTTYNNEQEWTFMSVQFWDEVPYGNWMLQMSLSMDHLDFGMLDEWSMIMYGTSSRIIENDNASVTGISVTTSHTNYKQKDINDGLTPWQVTGIVISVIVLIMIIFILVYYKKKKKLVRAT